MNVLLGTDVNLDAPSGVAQYWARLIRGVKELGVNVTTVPLSGIAARAVPGRSLVIVDNHDALAVPSGVAVIAVQHGSAGEHLARVPSWKAGSALVEKQRAAANRRMTMWVGCSEWAQWCCRKWQGVTAEFIINSAVDIVVFAPSDRQRTRSTPRPVVLHHCADPNKGSNHVGAVAKTCGDRYVFRRLACAADLVSQAMREADMWLCLSAAEGLPTVVQEAMATDLVVVSTKVGILWQGDLAKATGAVVFEWKKRDDAGHVGRTIQTAWVNRAQTNGRAYAVEHWALAPFARQWVACIEAATDRWNLS